MQGLKQKTGNSRYILIGVPSGHHLVLKNERRYRATSKEPSATYEWQESKMHNLDKPNVIDRDT